MNSTAYLNRLLDIYSGTFDIHKPYKVDDKEYPAYGYFFSSIEKYVLSREANLWTSDSYEHILFLQEDCTLEKLSEVKRLWQEYMEPCLVRRGKRFPEKNHMYSYLTVIIITDYGISREVEKQIKKTKFDRGYCFNLRGFSQGHLVVVDSQNKKVYTNPMASKSKKMFIDIFNDKSLS